MRSIVTLTAVLLASTVVYSNEGEPINDLEPIGSAEAHVFANVVPNIAVAFAGPANGVFAGDVRFGEFSAQIPFRVDANMQSLCLYVDATPLYKGDVYNRDPLVDLVSPIPLMTTVVISPDFANPLDGADNEAELITPVPAAEISDVPGALRSESICFESGQDGHFSQGVIVTVTWDQDDPEKTQGQYSGVVKLWAIPVDSQTPLQPDYP